jgi:hypothetical protein
MSGKILAKNELSVEEDKMNAKASMCKFRSVGCLVAICLSLWGGIGVASDEPDHDKDGQRTTAEDFLRLGVRPIAIGHHGVGPNSGANPDPLIGVAGALEGGLLPFPKGSRWCRESCRKG